VLELDPHARADRRQGEEAHLVPAERRGRHRPAALVLAHDVGHARANPSDHERVAVVGDDAPELSVEARPRAHGTTTGRSAPVPSRLSVKLWRYSPGLSVCVTRRNEVEAVVARSHAADADQLSRAHDRDIRTLDAIPDEELETLARWGITGLWLIGLWERSKASETIKRLRGNTDAVASAYSLDDYRHRRRPRR